MNKMKVMSRSVLANEWKTPGEEIKIERHANKVITSIISKRRCFLQINKCSFTRILIILYPVWRCIKNIVGSGR